MYLLNYARLSIETGAVEEGGSFSKGVTSHTVICYGQFESPWSNWLFRRGEKQFSRKQIPPRVARLSYKSVINLGPGAQVQQKH